MSLGAGLHDAGNNVAAALDDAKHNRFVVRLVCRIMTADKGFVGFYRLAGTTHRRIAVNVAHVESDQVAHAPRGLVGHAQLALELFRGHTVPRRRRTGT